jgi:hypothetical protein
VENFRQNVSWTDKSYPGHSLALLYVLSVCPGFIYPTHAVAKNEAIVGGKAVMYTTKQVDAWSIKQHASCMLVHGPSSTTLV